MSRGEGEGYDVRVYNSTGPFAKGIKTEIFSQAINLCVSVPGVRSPENESFAVCTCQVTQRESFDFIIELSCRKATAGSVCLLQATFMSQVVFTICIIICKCFREKEHLITGFWHIATYSTLKLCNFLFKDVRSSSFSSFQTGTGI